MIEIGTIKCRQMLHLITLPHSANDYKFDVLNETSIKLTNFCMNVCMLEMRWENVILTNTLLDYRVSLPPTKWLMPHVAQRVKRCINADFYILLHVVNRSEIVASIRLKKLTSPVGGGVVTATSFGSALELTAETQLA